MLDAAWLIPALPLAGFIVLVVAGRRLGDPAAGWLATAAVGGAFLFALIAFAGLLDLPGEERVFVDRFFTWVDVGGLQIEAAVLIDPLSITMALFVTGVGFLIHLYSVGYMHGDPGYARFFVYLNLFTFSMLVLVLADNFLVSFLGWEGVGACSYLLISFWFTRERAAVAGKKAFVTNRVGDLGFLLAMFVIFGAVGSLSYGEVFAVAPGLPEVTATAIALLLFLGACGKSAQLPLFTWLPDAMEGPTPVSALIHAATMVTAGVYLMARVNPILVASPDALTVVAVVGGVTALFAATVACAQNDIKRVLAYSTISQLGYMFLAVGSQAYVAAIFHMVTHAFFKALLFLGAGSVIHGLHQEQDMKRMGGLRRWMPVTWATFLCGWLAISGVPPLAGFWSKDDILLNAWDRSPALWAVGAVTALLTAYYMSRQVFLVFYGDERWRHAPEPALAVAGGTGGSGAGGLAEPAAADAANELTEPEPAIGVDATSTAAAATASAHGDHAGEPHESPWVMTGPLVVLAVLSVVGGAINLPFEGLARLEHFLEPVFAGRLRDVDVTSGTKLALAVTAAAAALIGIAAALAWLRRSENPSLEPVVLRKAWGIDALYSALVDGPARLVAAWSAFVVDRRIVDGAVNGLGLLVRNGGSRLRSVQTGYVRNYALGLAGGAVLLLAYVAIRSGL